MRDALSISIVGRNEIDCEGLRRIFEHAGFGINRCVRDRPGLRFDDWTDDASHMIVVDGVSAETGLAICAQARAALPSVRMLLLSEQCELGLVKDAFAAGVDGVTGRDIGARPLVGVAELIALGEKVFPSQIVDAFTRNFISAGNAVHSGISLRHFSAREIDILRCLATGESNKIIARNLGVTEATVKAHVKTILRKLQLGNRTQAAIWAMARGLDPEEPGIRVSPTIREPHS